MILASRTSFFSPAGRTILAGGFSRQNNTPIAFPPGGRTKRTISLIYEKTPTSLSKYWVSPLRSTATISNNRCQNAHQLIRRITKVIETTGNY